MPAGRPSKYDPAYCDAVVEHMKDGSSLTSFAAEIDVARSTINEWMEAHREFSEACARAKAKCAAWWEKTNRTLASTGTGNQGACKLGLTNMAPDEWRDKREHEHSGSLKVERVERIIVDPANPDS
jgi:hypothetical protein